VAGPTGPAGAAVRYPAVTASSTPGPLDGLVVADFSRVLAGPYCTMLLGDLGAEVIKVESPAGDDTRHWVPPLRDDMGTYYLSINRNKRSVVLDLGAADDLDVAHRLVARADVMIQNFKPGGLVRFGLDYPTAKASNPGIVYCSISGFGTEGGASLPGYDLLVQGVSGLMSLTGSPDSEPMRAGVAVFDVITGLHSAVGILAALRQRAETGVGQHVETNLLSSALSALVNQTSAYVAGGVVPNRMGNAHLSIFPYEPFETADGELIVISGNDAQFRRLAEALGVPELADDERYATNLARNANRGTLKPILVARLATRTAQEWFDVLTAVGIPCGPINDVKGGVELADRLGLDPVVMAGDVPTVRNPIGLDANPPSYRSAPPRLGADSDAVRRWLLEDVPLPPA
jgi:crotonobetainyl-CoA:carnitine CoA-transferase CaiB-like acyl-CoA transferase